MVTAAVIGGTLAAGAISSSGARSAANTQAAAANRATDVGLQEFNTITQQEQPYMQSGYGALSQLNYLLGIPQQGQTIDMAQQPGGGWAMAPDGTMQPRMTNAPAAPTFDPYAGGGGVAGMIGNYVNAERQGITAPSQPRTGGGFAGMVGNMVNAERQLNANQGMTPGGQPAGPVSGVPAPSSPAGGFGSLVKPFSISDFYNYSPAYQFQKQQGTQGVLNANAAGQGALSGAAMKDLIDYNQSLASTSFGNAFNQYQTQQGNIFNRLSGIAQLGQTAAANTGQQGTALTGQIGQSITNAGTAAAAGQVGQANAWSGALSSAAPWLAYGGGGGITAPSAASDSYINANIGYPSAFGG